MNCSTTPLALHTYHDAHNAMPPGCLIPGDMLRYDGHPVNNQRDGVYAGTDGKALHMIGWSAFLLPYVEATALYSGMDFGKAAYLPPELGTIYQDDSAVEYDYTADPKGVYCVGNEEAGRNAPSLFKCPSSAKSPVKNATKDYSANGFSRVLVRTGGTENWSPSGTVFPERAFTGNTGLFNKASGYGFGDIVDGTSNTIAFLEAHGMRPLCSVGGNVTPSQTRTYNPFYWTHHPSYGFTLTDKDANRLVINAKTYSSWGDGARSAFGTHTGGVNVSIADGSVQFISQTISHDYVYRALMTRAGGESVSIPNTIIPIRRGSLSLRTGQRRQWI